MISCLLFCITFGLFGARRVNLSLRRWPAVLRNVSGDSQNRGPWSSSESQILMREETSRISTKSQILGRIYARTRITEMRTQVSRSPPTSRIPWRVGFNSEAQTKQGIPKQVLEFIAQTALGSSGVLSCFCIWASFSPYPNAQAGV